MKIVFLHLYLIHSLISVHCVNGEVDLSSPEGCFSNGQCTFSSTVNDWTVSDSQECLEKCSDDPECHFFTFWEEGSSCVGFANCQDISTDFCDNCFSGSEDCEGKKLYIFNCIQYVLIAFVSVCFELKNHISKHNKFYSNVHYNCS